MDAESHRNKRVITRFLPSEELAIFDPELFPHDHVIEKRKAREALIKSYVDVRKLAFIAAGLGDKGLSQL